MTIATRELRRQQYLRALGVTPLVARRPLPAAAPALRVRVEVAQTVAEVAEKVAQEVAQKAARDTDLSRMPPVTESQGPAQSPAARPATASVARPSLGRQLREERATPRAVLEEPPTAVPVRAQPVARFSVAALVAGGRLWVEDLGELPLAREQVALITAIARALVHPEGVPAKPPLAQFDWPLSDNPQLDHGEEEARAALQGFLQRLLREHDCSELMCCGSVAQSRLPPAGELPVAVRLLPSSRELLDSPTRKRSLWQELCS